MKSAVTPAFYPPKPQAKLMRRGPESLEDAELFALLLGADDADGAEQADGQGSTAIQTAIQTANQLLAQFGSIGAVLAAPWEKISLESGVGRAGFAALQAGQELCKRAAAEPMCDRSLTNARPAIDQFLISQLAALPHEVFGVMYLDSQHRLIRFETVFQGGLNQTTVYPREVARRCLQLNAAAVIAAHNHPSGLAEPSMADQLLTTRLRQTLSGLEITLLDHLLVAGSRVISVDSV